MLKMRMSKATELAAVDPSDIQQWNGGASHHLTLEALLADDDHAHLHDVPLDQAANCNIPLSEVPWWHNLLMWPFYAFLFKKMDRRRTNESSNISNISKLLQIPAHSRQHLDLHDCGLIVSSTLCRRCRWPDTTSHTTAGWPWTVASTICRIFSSITPSSAMPSWRGLVEMPQQCGTKSLDASQVPTGWSRLTWTWNENLLFGMGWTWTWRDIDSL